MQHNNLTNSQNSIAAIPEISVKTESLEEDSTLHSLNINKANVKIEEGEYEVGVEPEGDTQMEGANLEVRVKLEDHVLPSISMDCSVSTTVQPACCQPITNKCAQQSIPLVASTALTEAITGPHHPQNVQTQDDPPPFRRMRWMPSFVTKAEHLLCYKPVCSNSRDSADLMIGLYPTLDFLGKLIH